MPGKSVLVQLPVWAVTRAGALGPGMKSLASSTRISRLPSIGARVMSV
jgi:hypothetical protein